MKVIDHSKYAPDCTCCDDWGRRTTCGQPTGSADLWQDTCPRCAELAALEREIGRAVIGIEMLTNMHYADPCSDLIYEAREAAYQHRLNLITRYRALLAAGAEAATGGEEAR